jgi:hypothetical protein
VPFLVWGFFKLITPFIDPHTREKLKFNEDMRQYVPAEQLWTTFKGDLDFEYDHSVYWPAMIKLATERREGRKERWEAGGKHIGESEDYLSGHAPTGVAASAPADKAVEAVTEAVAEVKLEEPKAVSEPKAEEHNAAHHHRDLAVEEIPK